MRIHGTIIVAGRVGPFSIDTRRVSTLLAEALTADPTLAVDVSETLVVGDVKVAELANLPVGHGVSVTLDIDDELVAKLTGTTGTITEAEATSKAAGEAGA